MKSLVIAVDGPSASGKGTIASRLSQHFSLPHLNTGILYRLVARRIIDRKLDRQNFELVISSLVENLLPKIEPGVSIDFDLSESTSSKLLLSDEVSVVASLVARSQLLRSKLFSFQREFVDFSKREFGGVVIEGRDTTTVICPDADYKFFVTAKVEIRAQRRFNQLKHRGENPDFEVVLRNLKLRDESDANREIAPLQIAPGAHVIDNSELTAAQSFEVALSQLQAPTAKINPQLLSVLACPQCKGELSESALELICNSCKLAYPVENRIPVMLADEARKF